MVDENYYLGFSNVHGIRDKSRRAWKRLKWEPDDIQELRSRVALNVGYLNAFNGSLIRCVPEQRRENGLTCCSKVTLATKSEVERLHERQDTREQDEEARSILDWLTLIDYDADQNDFLSRRQEGTGKWLLESTAFQSWLKANKQTLFCPGIPGAGKTIQTSIVIDDLRTRFQANESVGIAFLYCNFKRSHEQKLDNLLSSLLRQLAQGRPVIPDAVKSLFLQHQRGRTRPTIDEILQALRSVISGISNAFIVIDALDECQVKEECRAKFITELSNLSSKYGANVLATSRLIPEIIDGFEGAMTLEIRASGDDVRRYVESHLSRLPKCVAKSPDLQEKIKAVIVNAVDGMCVKSFSEKKISS